MQNVCSEYVSTRVCRRLFVYLCTHTCLNIHIIIREIQARKIVNFKPITNFSFKDSYKVVCKIGINCDKRFKWNNP